MAVDTPKTVLIGMDALSFNYLDQFELPNIHSLRSQGVEAELESTFPPWTGSAWPSVYTGVDPSHHGVYSFFDFRGTSPDEADIVSQATVRSPAIWEYLSTRGVSASVLNVPVTHSADSFDGSLIPGYLAPESASGSPAGIRDDLSSELGEQYRIYGENEAGDGSTAVDDFVSLIDHRRQAARAFLESTDWEFAFLQLQKTDTVFHEFEQLAAYRRVYEAADEFVGMVLETVPDETNVIICSDHGIGRTDGYNIYINEILRRNGFVETCAHGRTPTLGESKAELNEKAEGSDDRSTSIQLVSTAESALGAVGLTPGDAYRLVQRLGAESIVKRLLPDGAHAALGENVDWRRSQAYCRSGPELGVRINLEGRDENGEVLPDNYEGVRSELIQILESLRTPDGKPAFEWVKPREAVYDGPYTEEACDILFMPRAMNNLIATNLLGSMFVPIDKHNHKRTGVFIGAGSRIDEAPPSEIGPLSVIDVAPIAMALLDEPVPARMQGSVPPEVVVDPPRVAEYDAIDNADSRNDGERPEMDSDRPEDDAMIDRLENLGYL
ncbi:nucleotide pyrophosphatase [Haloterrigena sp. H1]|uniref:alkaline phosphatase family protein n=1 Tax=Haloterrigena sp. H1 TaxID=2552943 RepID=UPI00110DE956|nr:alkaline phosphatase family protein [Haloterrigena sp. H1]TMT86905.1 nucleotide pyrophosphatase [Haloterrigena sp. H1]